MIDTWNLKLLFAGDDDPQMAVKRKVIEEQTRAFIQKWKNRHDYTEDSAILQEALIELEKWQRFSASGGNEWYYFWLKTNQDQNDPNLKARFNKIDEFAKKIENDIKFFYLAVAKIPIEQQTKFLNYPGLKPYYHWLERAFAEGKYLLSEAEEKILTLKSATSYSNWVDMTAAFLSKEEREVAQEDGQKIIKSFNDLGSLMENQNKTVRDSAAEAFNDVLNKYIEVAEHELNSILANKKIDDQLRGFTRSDEDRHLADDVETEVVDTLAKAVSGQFAIAQDYYRLKAKLLSVEKLAYHERNVAYGRVDKTYSYDEAVRLVEKVMTKLDPQFAQIFKQFSDNGQIDVYARKNKADGAFCAYDLISQPTYILLNYTNRLRDVLTLAHELGHGINDELIRAKQHALHFGTSTFTAEVASTFMEDFVLEEILKEADDELKLTILMTRLNDHVSTIFRQIAAYQFEQDLHLSFRTKGYLSKEEIGQLFQKHMADYMGEAVEQSAGSANWWVYWSHIRMFFYVYSYAGGLLISKALQSAVRQNPQFMEKVKQFLSVGLSQSPRAMFKDLGIDILDEKFWQKGLLEVKSLLDETTQLAKKLGKI